jgi:hypothetical protein
MRKLKSAFSRKQGLSTKDSTFKVRDFIEQRQAEGKALLADMHDLYLKFEGQLRREGWDKNLNEAQSRAVNGYLQGMSRESISQAYEVQFSEPAIDRLNEVKQKLRQFSVNAQAAGVFSDARIITVIQEGRPYLHAVTTRNMRWHRFKRAFGKDARVTPKEVEGLHPLFVAAWDLPMTEEAVNGMKRGQLKKLINKHSVYTQGLPNEQDTQNTTWSYIEREDGSKLHLFEKREAGEPLKWAKDVTTEELREYVKSVELTDEAIDQLRSTTSLVRTVLVASAAQ